MKIVIITFLLVLASPVYGAMNFPPAIGGGSIKEYTVIEYTPAIIKEPEDVKKIEVPTTTQQMIELESLIRQLRALIEQLRAQQK